MQDQQIKKKLIYAYHILAYLKLDDHTYTHLSARSSDKESFYIYPFGLRFEEVTEEDLLCVSLDGKIIEGKQEYNKTGYLLHGSLYKKRRDISAIFHIHTPEIVAVSAKDSGLLPISQWALHFYGKISYHDYSSLFLHNDQSNSLIDDMGDNYNMLLRNHGSITSGRTIEEAMFYTYHLQQACVTQLLASNNDRNITPDHKTCQRAVNDLLSFEENLGARDWKAWVRLIDRNRQN